MLGKLTVDINIEADSASKSPKIRRYEKRETQYSQNKMFKEDTKNF